MSEQIKRKELKVLKFINKNRNWEEELSSPPYNLIIKRKGQYILLKYDQLNSDMSNDIVQECRGLIIKPDLFALTSNPPIKQYQIVSMRFTKFFNYGQEEAAKLEFPCEASEKIDGSLIGVWYDKETGWHVSTSGNIDAKDAPINIGSINNYRELFDLAWGDLNFNIYHIKQILQNFQSPQLILQQLFVFLQYYYKRMILEPLFCLQIVILLSLVYYFFEILPK